MDVTTFANAMGRTLPTARYQALLPAWNNALLQANCITPNRVAMWCAQVGHESVGLRYMEEIASGAAYEGRRDLGNTRSGDGRRYKGHGPIQITGRFNHTKVSEWAYSKGYTPTPWLFVDRPELLGSDRYGFLGVVWYWTVARNMNSYADAGDIRGATRAVNGGYNGLADRVNRWNRCRAMGNQLLPTQEDDVTPEQDRMLREVHAQLYRREPPWGGGYTDDTGSPYDAFMYGKRSNVELHQCWLAVQDLHRKVDQLMRSPR